MNRRGFVWGATVLTVFSPLVARAASLMRLRGPTLYTGPRLRVAVMQKHDVYNEWRHRVVEVPWQGTAEFGAWFDGEGVHGRVLGMTGVPELPAPPPYDENAHYDRPELKKRTLKLAQESVKWEGKGAIYTEVRDDGRLRCYRKVDEVFDIGE